MFSRISIPAFRLGNCTIPERNRRRCTQESRVAVGCSLGGAGGKSVATVSPKAGLHRMVHSHREVEWPRRRWARIV